MTDLHAIVTRSRAWKRHAAEIEKLDARYEQMREKVAEAQAVHDEQMAEYRRQLDAGTAPASGPPPFHAPGDLAALLHERTAIRARRRDVLAAIADEAEHELRNRESELLDLVAEVVADVIEPARAELAEIIGTVRAITAARGITVANTALPAGLDLAELVATAGRGRVLPASVVPNQEPAPAWTHDTESGEGRPALAGHRLHPR